MDPLLHSNIQSLFTDNSLTGIVLYKNEKVIFCSPWLTTYFDIDFVFVKSVFCNEDGIPYINSELPWNNPTTNKAEEGVVLVACNNNQKEWYLVQTKAGFNNDPSIVCSLFTNITKQKKAEVSLRNREERYTLAIEAATDAILDWNITNNTIYATVHWKTILGYTYEELPKTFEPWSEFIEQSERDVVIKQLQSFLNDIENTSYKQTFSMIHKEGYLVHVMARGLIIRNAKGVAIRLVIVFTDVTAEVEMDKVKTEFVSLASHQLRTPLTTVSWYAELLANENISNLNEDQLLYIKEIQEGNKRMVELVDALLNVSRFDLGTFAVLPAMSDVSNIISIVIEEEKIHTQQKDLTLNTYFDPQAFSLSVDPNLMRIIAQNLISNAVKYTPQHGVITISLTVTKHSFVFSVQDNGCGIIKEDYPKIFSKLFRAQNAKEIETNGTGLGLYLVKKIVDASGGDIKFESWGQGTTFTVTYPLDGMKKTSVV